MQTGDITVALLYRRVSDEERQKEQGLSLETQAKDLERFVQQQGWIIGGEFEDAETGTWVQRPEYQRMLSEARRLRQEGWRVVLVVRRLDRLGRNLGESIRCRDEMQSIGADIWSVAEGLLGKSSSARLQANLQATVAQYEVEQLSERVRAVLGGLRDAGFHNGGRAPWGYRWRPANHAELAQGAPKRGRVLDVDPVSAAYVRQAFERVAEGASCREVAAWVATLPDAAKQDERGKVRALAWPNVRNMLSAPVYIARHEVRIDSGDEYVTGRDGKKRRNYRYSRDPQVVLAQPVGQWPALIDDVTWKKVQENIQGHKKLPRQASGQYLLTGIARCPLCGRRLVGTFKNSGRHKPRYHCSQGIQAKVCSFSVTAAIIDALTLNDVLNVVQSAAAGWTTKLAKQVLRAASGGGEGAARAEQLHAELEKLARRRAGANMAVSEQVMSFADYRTTIAQIDAEVAEKRAELATLGRPERGSAEVELVLAQAAAWHDILRDGSTRDRREVLPILVEKVFPIRYGPTGREYEVEIEWTPIGKTAVRLSTAKGRIEAGLA